MPWDLLALGPRFLSMEASGGIAVAGSLSCSSSYGCLGWESLGGFVEFSVCWHHLILVYILEMGSMGFVDVWKVKWSVVMGGDSIWLLV
jgi:hypothetical protein